MPSHPTAGNGSSALLALRNDLAGQPTTRDDDATVVVATLLRHAAAQPGSTQSRKALASARRVARAALGRDPHGNSTGRLDEPGPLGPFTLLRAVADEAMRVRGRMTLANNILASLTALIPAETREGGLLLSQRAATSWYLGDNDLSIAQYRELGRLGARINERELIVRALHGVAHVRMSAGNFPAAEPLLRRAVRLAGDDFPRVVSAATVKLAIIESTRGHFDRALEHAWNAYQRAPNSGQRQAVLNNLAQILLDAGHPAAARSAAKHLLRSELRFERVFSTLSTYATASAALGDVRVVEWCAARVRALAKPPAFAQHVADAMLECSFALDDVGRTARAARLRDQARELATRHGYHDVAYLAEHGIRRGKPRRPYNLKKAAQVIEREVRALEPDHRPLAELHVG